MGNPVIRRIASGDAHTNEKWLVLEGSLGPVVKRRSINTAALASGDLTLENEVAKLKADVVEYHARWLAVEKALESLNANG